MWNRVIREATCAKPITGAPGCVPAFRPLLRRNDFGGGFANPSEEGGFDEFEDYLGSAKAVR
jgi:hypothetical protein